MKVLIVDDEPVMLLAMRRMLSSMDEVEIVGSFQHAADALHFVKNEEVDLAFLDIQIAEDNGLELARGLIAVCEDLDIVFTTSHAEYAIHAYDVYPLDYMVKPISRIRLTQTITKAISRRKTSGHATSASDVATPARKLMIRGLNCFEASSEQAGSVKWMSKKSMELFAYLLVYRGRSVTKSRLIEDVFPERSLKQAEVYLHTAVYQLRKVLAQHGFKDMIQSAQEHYRVDLDDVEVDFIRFELAVSELAEINATNEAEAIALEKQFSGELFEGKSFEWADVERERLSMIYLSYAKRLANWLLKQKKFNEAAFIAKKVVAYNEFEEESILLLLHIFGSMGNLQSLQRYYEQYKELLLQELSVEPPITVEELYEKYQTF